MRALFLLFIFLWAAAASADQQKQQPQKKSPVLRAASIRASEINVRVGPGVQYPVIWVLLCPGVPVKIMAEFGIWRKIEDPLGTQGWVHKSMLSGKKTLFVQCEQNLYASPNLQGRPLARLAKGVILEYLKSEERADLKWHYVRIRGIRGFVAAKACWGLE